MAKWKDHLGKEYKNRQEMCKKYQIDSRTFQRRMERGWTLEDALTKKPYSPYQTHIGETKTMQNGVQVSIIGRGRGKDERYYQMKTSDGFEFEGMYSSFKKGTLDPYRSCQYHIGQTNRMNNGETGTITAIDREKKHVMVRTESGEERYLSYESFQHGCFLTRKELSEQKRLSVLHEKIASRDGLTAEVVQVSGFDEKRRHYQIFLRWEDNAESVISDTLYKNYQNGKSDLIHSELNWRNTDRNFHGYRIKGAGILIDKDTFYEAVHLSDGKEVFMTPQMMMAAEKEEKSHQEPTPMR